MLSICIPIYNYNVVNLVEELHMQALQAGIPFEILAVDDASDEMFRTQNQQISLPHVKYIQLDSNIGRSKIRNFMAAHARYSALLFIDCDSAVASSSYVKNYIPYLSKLTVCCGGRRYLPTAPVGPEYLRWKYGVERESQNAQERDRSRYSGFQSNNFLISKEIFDVVKFDETITEYGHEDTLFGLELSSCGFPVVNIDNPLIHMGLEPASFFLEKTYSSVLNLHRIERILRNKSGQKIYSKLTRSEFFLRKFRLSGIVAIFFRLFRRLIERHLLGERPSLRVFDLYRLCLLCTFRDG